MKIGGKFYLANVQQQKRFSYSRQLNRRALEAQRQAVQFYGDALFAAKITQGQESVRLTIQQFAKRVAGEMEARFASYDQLRTSVSELASGAGGGIDLKV
jgi:hypothetical protein